MNEAERDYDNLLRAAYTPDIPGYECPECKSYLLRDIVDERIIERKDWFAEGKKEITFRCRECEHEWKVIVKRETDHLDDLFNHFLKRPIGDETTLITLRKEHSLISMAGRIFARFWELIRTSKILK